MSDEILQELKAELIALRTDIVLMKYSVEKIESQMEFITTKMTAQNEENEYHVEKL